MAKILPNRFVNDLIDRQAIGVSIPFSNSGVFHQTYTTADQTKSNLINYFLTNKGERILKCNYGGNLRNILFEQISEETLIVLQQRLKTDISLKFPIVEVKSLTVTPQSDLNIINITLIYDVLNLENEVIEINVENSTGTY
jgi:phage baseplate assembly protein W|tara:strand:+ start:1205 stop:1627 length:423 start_codon:yes stop_codon:yes gene_type:complete